MENVCSEVSATTHIYIYIGLYIAHINLYSPKMDGIGRHRALHTLKASFLIKMDGIGPYILLHGLIFLSLNRGIR